MRILYSALVIISTFGHSSVGFDLSCIEPLRPHLPYSVSELDPSHTNDGLAGECVVHDLVVTSSDDAITSVNGKIVPSNDVTKLSIRRGSVKFFPKNISFFFPNLLQLEISDSELKWIEQSDISGLKALQTLNLTGNNLQVLERGLFAHNLNLQVINLRENQLQFIYSDIFDHLSGLISIDLEDNSCTNSFDYLLQYLRQPVDYRSTIRDELNYYCQSWKTFHDIHTTHLNYKINKLRSEIEQLSHQLRTCDRNLDAALANYRQEKFTNSNLEFIDKPADKLTINLTWIEENTATATEFRVPFANLSIDSEHIKSNVTTSLVIHQQQTLFLPQNLAECFPILVELSVTESGLCEVDHNVFKGLADVVTLKLAKNKILNIPTDTFEDLTNLSDLDLSSNQIRSLENDVFVRLQKLQTLDLRSNYLTSIKSEVLKHLANLMRLQLQDNRLRFISSNLFSTLSDLTLVSLSNNECIDMEYPKSSLAEIETTIIDNCIAPVEMTCKLTQIETSQNEGNNYYHCNVEGLFTEYPKTKISKFIGADDDRANLVRTFFVEKQSIKYFPFEISRKFPNLKRIEIQQSNLISLQPMDFDGFAQLIEIVVNENNLTSIKAGAFDTVPKLELLDLSSNHIESLPSNIFAKLTQLNTLILSNNEIVRFAANVLPRKNHINIFRIDNNELEFIETKTIRFLRKANTIDLTENVCIDMKFVKTENRTRALIELSGEIDLNCSSDD